MDHVQRGQRQGPVAEEQLKQLAASGQLKPTDKVWKHGMAAWKAASAVEGLIPTTATAVPPPIPSAAIPPYLPQAALMPSALLTPKRIAICAVAVVVFVVGLLAIKAMFFGFGRQQTIAAGHEEWRQIALTTAVHRTKLCASSAPGPRATLIFSSPLVGRWS